MTLEEFNAVVKEASQKAHMFVAGFTKPERVKSVSLRLDDDGVLSIVLHKERMPSRVPTDEAAKIDAAVKGMQKLVKKEPKLKGAFDDFDGFFVHMNEITEVAEESGENLDGESVADFIWRIIEERNEAQLRLERIEKAQPEEVEDQAQPEEAPA